MKYLYLFAIALFATSYSSSQNKPFLFGIKGGIDTFKYVSNESLNRLNPDEFDNSLGYFIGGYLNIDVSKKLKIQPEIQLFFHNRTENIRNIEFQDPDNGVFITPVGSSNLDVKEQIIYLPVIFQYEIIPNLYAEAGPQFGYVIKKKLEVNSDTFSFDGFDNAKILDYEFDNFDFGISVGLGYFITEEIGLNIRCYKGLNERDNILKSSILTFGIEFRFN